MEGTGAGVAAGWDGFLTGWFQGMSVPLGLSKCGDLTLEVVGAEILM